MIIMPKLYRLSDTHLMWQAYFSHLSIRRRLWLVYVYFLCSKMLHNQRLQGSKKDYIEPTTIYRSWTQHISGEGPHARLKGKETRRGQVSEAVAWEQLYISPFTTISHWFAVLLTHSKKAVCFTGRRRNVTQLHHNLISP